MKILSIDDSNSIRHAVKKMLDVIGAEFFEAGDGVEGLELLERIGKMDLILLDMEMPRMDGMTFLETVKKDPRWKDIPVIILSSIAQRERMIKAIQEGAKQYLTKPFTSEQLLVKVVEALNLDEEIP
ncbi:MAG: response regulator [Fibrobacterota bacterium]|nr:response regulator [Fibrobacterota bacterium]QQS07293.1 MAG: response regulator [Fibrobacterota bacterium]